MLSVMTSFLDFPSVDPGRSTQIVRAYRSCTVSVGFRDLPWSTPSYSILIHPLPIPKIEIDPLPALFLRVRSGVSRHLLAN
jgi:hypothetical protein